MYKILSKSDNEEAFKTGEKVSGTINCGGEKFEKNKFHPKIHIPKICVHILVQLMSFTNINVKIKGKYNKNVKKMNI